MQSFDLIKRSSRETKSSRNRHITTATMTANSDSESSDTDAQDARSVCLQPSLHSDNPTSSNTTNMSPLRFAPERGYHPTSQPPAPNPPPEPMGHDSGTPPATRGIQSHHQPVVSSKLTFTPPAGTISSSPTNRNLMHSSIQSPLSQPKGSNESIRWMNDRYVGEPDKPKNLERENAALKMYCEKLKGAIHHRDIVISELQAEVQDLQHQIDAYQRV
ncbi:hypothetical protein HK096_002138 [Nowakowskiella sp. JEL0078]|nr:hypothetical protein HK096_002138 [Nowakowskiella sp. JEL0078]